LGRMFQPFHYGLPSTQSPTTQTQASQHHFQLRDNQGGAIKRSVSCCNNLCSIRIYLHRESSQQDGEISGEGPPWSSTFPGKGEKERESQAQTRRSESGGSLPAQPIPSSSSSTPSSILSPTCLRYPAYPAPKKPWTSTTDKAGVAESPPRICFNDGLRHLVWSRSLTWSLSQKPQR
jgi:hypothetical protein